MSETVGMFVNVRAEDRQAIKEAAADLGLTMADYIVERCLGRAALPRGPYADLERRVAALEEKSMTFMVEIPSTKAQAYRELVALILDDMPAATNADLACDGPVGGEERKVWERIERQARAIRNKDWR